MSVCSRAAKRLRDLYSLLLRRMWANEARLFGPRSTSRPPSRWPALEPLEPRVMLDACPGEMSYVCAKWAEVGSSDLMEDFFTQAFTPHQERLPNLSFSSVMSTPLPTLDVSSSTAVADSTAFSLSIDGEVDISPASYKTKLGAGVEIGGDAALEAAMSLGYTLSWNPTGVGTGHWKLARGKQVSLSTELAGSVEWKDTKLIGEVSGGIKVGYEYWVEIPTLSGLTADKNMAVGMTFSVGSEPYVKGAILTSLRTAIRKLTGLDLKPVDLGLKEGLTCSYQGDLSLTLQTSMTVREFVSYTEQSSVGDAMADFFVPCWLDTPWQCYTAALTTVVPVLTPLGVLSDISRTDTPLGMLAANLNTTGGVQILVQANAATAWNGWVKPQATAEFRAKSKAVDVEVGATLGLSLTWGEAKTLWDKRFSTIEQEPWLVSTAAMAKRLDRVKVHGVTVITHGYQPDDESTLDSGRVGLHEGGDVMYDLAEAIRLQTNGWLIDYDVPGDGGLGGYDESWSYAPDVGKDEFSGEVILLWDWAPGSNEASAGWAEAAGDALFADLIGLGLIDPGAGAANPSLHFIGHGAGAVVTSEAVERLAAYNVPVEHLTYLDPHDFIQTELDKGGAYDGTKVEGDGAEREQRAWAVGYPYDNIDEAKRSTGNSYGAAVWSNVIHADVYYQTRGMTGDLGETWNYRAPCGRPIAGAFNVLLRRDDRFLPAKLPGPPEDPTLLDNPYSARDFLGDHNFVWNGYYMATVLGHVPSQYADRELAQVPQLSS